MKAFNKIFVAVIAMIILIFAVFNLLFASSDNTDSGRPYRVEINRLVFEIEQSGFDSVDMSGCEYVTHIEKYRDKFYDSDSDYTIREINGVLYRFDYTTDMESDQKQRDAYGKYYSGYSICDDYRSSDIYTDKDSAAF